MSRMTLIRERLARSWEESIWKDEWKPLLIIIAIFAGCFYLPIEWPRFETAIFEALALVKWYAREHVLLCLVPAFFIAGAIAVFVSQEGVMKFLGPSAPKWICYPVASVSGSVLAVCSCTVLPLFAGIWGRGAGLGPATAFLYSGPAINALAIILTARILGPEMGAARAIMAVVFSVVIGMLMQLTFSREERERAKASAMNVSGMEDNMRPLWKTGLFFGLMILILVFANWGKPSDSSGIWGMIYSAKWIITAGLSLMFAFALERWFSVPFWKVGMAIGAVGLAALLAPDNALIPFSIGIVSLSLITTSSNEETQEWFSESWGFAKQILPLLLIGVFIAGALLGRPGNEGLIPSHWVSWALGGNSLSANLFASVAGAFMYFATLTEVPIVQGLLGSGMGKGPALSLLLAGPALSLPNMLVINSVLGPKKTAVFVALVCIMATISGVIYGAIFG